MANIFSTSGLNALKSRDFHYDLPEELIAQAPLHERTQSRLLVYQRESGVTQHSGFSSLGDYLDTGDLLVLNDTRVMRARLYGRKITGGQLECLVERVIDETVFYAHIKTSKALKPGQIFFLGEAIKVEMQHRVGDLFCCRLVDNDMSVYNLQEQFGHMPLPPYITREGVLEDNTRYQTVYANELGAVAAPTAGLHFSDTLIEDLKSKGVQFGQLTLHVGAGTFQPVRVETVSDHVMHSEWLQISPQLVEQIKQTKQAGKRVIAVGTTVVRSLETAALSGELCPFEGDTDIFIYPGFDFKVIDGMITNFHLPESTLLMLVSAFCGKEKMMQLYQTAIEKAYRFFSYGDASLLL